MVHTKYMSEWKKERIEKDRERVRFYILFILLIGVLSVMVWGNAKLSRIEDNSRALNCYTFNHDRFSFDECLADD